MKPNRLRIAIGLVLATSGLVACGGSGGSGSVPASSTTTAIGVITGFGSIYVNGVEYHTTSASYSVDDDDAFDDSALRVGMMVKVHGSINDDGITGTAIAVTYDDELEGPVQNLATDPDDASIKTFTIFGVDIVVNSNTRFDNEDDAGFRFDTLANGDNVEISGFFLNDTLIASYIEKQDSLDEDFEVKGTVSGFSGDTFTLTHNNGVTLHITVAPGAELPDSGIQDGQYVEVEGTIPDPIGAPNDLLASKVELEDDDLFDDSDFADGHDQAEVRGVLSYNAGTDTWSINGLVTDFSQVAEYQPASLASAIADTSAAGMTLKIEGRVQNDALIAREVHSAFGDDDSHDAPLEIKGVVSSLAITDPKTGTITLSFGGATGSVVIQTNGSTLYLNDDSVDHFTLNDIAPGDYLEIEAFQNDLGDIIATALEWDDSVGEYEIEGPVDSYSTGNSITILGVTFATDGGTLVEDVPVAGQPGDVEDTDGDGVAERVDRED